MKQLQEIRSHEVNFFCSTELPNSNISVYLYKAHYMDMVME